jgi:hypothetical protein
VNQFKPFLYLSDVEEGNGPFTYLLGSHKNNEFLLKKMFECVNGRDTTSVSDEDVKKLGLTVKEFYGKKGTLILADTKGVHQGGTLAKGSRLAVSNYFYV